MYELDEKQKFSEWSAELIDLMQRNVKKDFHMRDLKSDFSEGVRKKLKVIIKNFKEKNVIDICKSLKNVNLKDFTLDTTYLLFSELKNIVTKIKEEVKNIKYFRVSLTIN